MCFCGRELDKHGDHVAVAVDLPDGNDGSAVPWDFERHTTQIEASCFGTVKFTGFGSEVTQEAPVRTAQHRLYQSIHARKCRVPREYIYIYIYRLLCNPNDHW